MQHTPSDLAQNPTHIIERIWRERPGVPRAVALLIYFMDCEDAVAEAIEAGEIEVAAGILAESQIGKSAFQREYGMAWRAAYTCFADGMHFAGQNPRRLAGERVVYAPLPRVLYRLGYIDGLAGALDPPPPPRGRPVDAYLAPPPETHAERRYVAGVQQRTNRVFTIAYDRGLAHGTAERVLEREAPALLDAIDAQAALHVALPMDDVPALVHQLRVALENVVTSEAVGVYLPETVKAARIYARARWREARRRIARERLIGYLNADGPVTPLAIGAAVRALYRARLRARQSGEHQAIADQQAEAVLLLSAGGFLADALAALEVDVGADGYQSVGDVIATSKRDYDAARRARAVLRALAESPPRGRLWPEPHSALLAYTAEADATADDRATAWNEAQIERLAKLAEGALEPETDDERQIAEEARWVKRAEEALVRHYRQLGLPPLPARAARALVAERTAALSPPSNPAGEALSNFLRLEQVTHLADDPLRGGLAATSATHWAEAALETEDPAAYRRVQGEREIVSRGGEREVEMAERWVTLYRREAASGGLATVHLRPGDRVKSDTPLAEAAAAAARARLVEAALDARARGEARYLVARSAPSAGYSVYVTPDPLESLAAIAALAAQRSRRDLAREYNTCPTFAARIERMLHVETLDWLVREAQVAAEIAPHLQSKEA